VNLTELILFLNSIKAYTKINSEIHHRFACSVVTVQLSDVGNVRLLEIIDSWRKEDGKHARY